MHHWLRRPLPGTTRFGRRTLILLSGGGCWLLNGWAIYNIPIERFSRPGPGGALEFMDTPWPGVMWMTGGILAIGNAVLRRRLHGRDVVGFLGLVTPPIVWWMAYLWSSALYLLTGPEHWAGNPRAAVGLITWTFSSLFVLLTAGWPDPDDPAIQPKPSRRRR